MDVLSKKYPPPHPGRVLIEQCLKPRGITQQALSEQSGLHRPRLNALIHGSYRVSPKVALRLGQVLGTRPQFWLKLQQDWDLWMLANSREGKSILKLEPFGKRLTGHRRAPERSRPRLARPA